MNAKRMLQLILTSLLLVVLSSCTTQMYKDAKKNVEQVRQDIDAAKEQYSLPPEDIGGKLHSYRNAWKVRHNSQPKWLRRKITLHGNEAPFEFLVEKTLTGTGAVASYQKEVDKQQTISINYRGTIKSALLALAAKTGYDYHIENVNGGFLVVWEALITKIFDVSFMPGASEYFIGKKKGSSGGNNSSDTGGSHGSNGQFSNLQGNLSVWRDIRGTLERLKSKEGEVYVSQATTTITIHDYPERVLAIERYLDQLNENMSREVALQVKVLQVDLNEGSNFGVNWDLVHKFMDVRVGFTSQLGSPVRLPSLGTNTAGSTAGFIVRGVKGGKWDGTNFLINALSQQGRVSTVTRPRVVTLNNQVAEIDINTQTGYLREISTTQTALVGSSTSLIPGNIKTGFTLYLLPKISHGDVYLQITSTISKLINLENFAVTLDSGDSSQLRPAETRIQLPTVTEKRFNQRALVPSGATLILAGFRQVDNTANNSKMFRQSALGGKGSEQKNSETIILITPTIIH